MVFLSVTDPFFVFVNVQTICAPDETVKLTESPLRVAVVPVQVMPLNVQPAGTASAIDFVPASWEAVSVSVCEGGVVESGSVSSVPLARPPPEATNAKTWESAAGTVSFSYVTVAPRGGGATRHRENSDVAPASEGLGSLKRVAVAVIASGAAVSPVTVIDPDQSPSSFVCTWSTPTIA